MAVLTRGMGILTDNGNVATVEVDYDDVSLTLVRVRCINGTAHAVVVSGTVTKNGRSFSQTFAANQTTEITLPQNTNSKLDITLNPQHGIDGINYSIRFA